VNDVSPRALPTVFAVDLGHHLQIALSCGGWLVEDVAVNEANPNALARECDACVVLDVQGSHGVALLACLLDARLPIVFVTDEGDVSTAVRAMRAGAFDVIERPIRRHDLLGSVERALERSRERRSHEARREAAAKRLAALTPRQHQIMDQVLAGQPSKNIAVDLGISRRTVENHRASIMKKTCADSLPALARLALGTVT
jgi:two-component system CheB/CheR fusion protein